jgi:flagellar hook protein FlgE
MPLTAFYSALTGLNNSSYALNVIGNNLANMNTTGFKTGSASFSELLGGLSGTGNTGDPIVAGLGSSLSGVQRSDTQGTVGATGKPTDMAINGNGFFVVDIGDGTGFTRAGNFQLDKNGNLINSDGYNVLGLMASNGVIDTKSAAIPIVVSIGAAVPAQATLNISVNANLDSKTAVSDAFSTAVSICDSLGEKHAVTLQFTRTAAGWDWDASIPALDTGGMATDPPVTIGNGSIAFDQVGNLVASTTNPTLLISGLSNGSANMSITLHLLDSQGKSNITGQASTSSVSKTLQDGVGASSLASFAVNTDGLVTGATANGQTINIAQMLLGSFANVNGLQKFKGSTLIASASSGEPSIGFANTGGRGSISGQSLEQSNVDMANEFVNLIAAQRAYQANSRVITTTDQLYQDSLNMKQ